MSRYARDQATLRGEMFIHVAGALVIFVALLNQIPGGLPEVLRVGAAAGKFDVLDLSFHPAKIYTLWAGVAGGIALTLATHGTDQFLVQRLLSADSPRSAARGLVLSGFIVFAQFTLFLLIGAMLFAYHRHFPLAAALPRNDAILPRFIVDHLPHGLIGFIVAAIVAAALSPSINAMAATTINDYYLKRTKMPPGEAQLLRLAKRLTVSGASSRLPSRCRRSGWISRCWMPACRDSWPWFAAWEWKRSEAPSCDVSPSCVQCTIRLSRKDLEAIQERALEEGLPYQTLTSSLLHKYAAGRLKEV